MPLALATAARVATSPLISREADTLVLGGIVWLGVVWKGVHVTSPLSLVGGILRQHGVCLRLQVQVVSQVTVLGQVRL